MDLILQKQIWRGIGVALSAAACAVFLYFVTPLVYPFLIGWLIAYIMNPFVKVLQTKARLPRWLAVTISLLAFLGITAAIVGILVTNIVYEISDLSVYLQNNMDAWKAKFVDFVNSDMLQGLIDRINTFYNDNPQYQSTIDDNLSSTGLKLATAGSALIGLVLNGIVSLIKSLPNFATILIIALLAAFFISKDWVRIKNKAVSWIPDKALLVGGTIWGDLQKALFGYLRAQFILISITAAFVIIGLLILQVPYAISIGLLIGLVDLLPYLGTGAVMVPWIIIVFIQGNITLGVGLSVLYGVILVARQILEPKVLATSVGMEPLSILIALFVGLQLFGFIGLIIGPVSFILLMAFHRANVFREIWNYVLAGRSRI